jgi:ABC-type branched-subunit amino acid transport system ATPase component
MSETVIAVKKLKKSYDGLIAVQDVSLDIQKGEILVSWGPMVPAKQPSWNALRGCDFRTAATSESWESTLSVTCGACTI